MIREKPHAREDEAMLEEESDDDESYFSHAHQ